MENQLLGKTAIVTGGSRGIGAAIAKRLARDGATVVITYSTSPDHADAVIASIHGSGGRGLAVRADSAKPEEVQSAIKQAAREFGGVDILVNNAGIARLANIVDFGLEDFDRLVAINVRGVFVASQEAARHMGEGGRIITIGSTNSDRMPFPGGSVYAMTKAAVAGLTRGMARDLGPRKITVNNVQPGPIDTEMNPEDGAFAAMLKGMIAVGRYGKDHEIASLVSYLAGPEAGYITGASLTIDGGFAA